MVVPPPSKSEEARSAAPSYQREQSERCPRNSPLIVDMNHDGYRLTSVRDGVWFDLDADGTPEPVAWTAPDSDEAFLALDRNGNGFIDSGAELFGNHTPTTNTSTRTSPRRTASRRCASPKGPRSAGAGATASSTRAMRSFHAWSCGAISTTTGYPNRGSCSPCASPISSRSRRTTGRRGAWIASATSSVSGGRGLARRQGTLHLRRLARHGTRLITRWRPASAGPRWSEKVASGFSRTPCLSAVRLQPDVCWSDRWCPALAGPLAGLKTRRGRPAASLVLRWRKRDLTLYECPGIPVREMEHRHLPWRRQGVLTCVPVPFWFCGSVLSQSPVSA